MKHSRFSEEQIIGILEHEADASVRMCAASMLAQHLQMEGQVQRDGCLRGQVAE